jgi:hypothetical protein
MCISWNLKLHNRGNMSTQKKERKEKMIRWNEHEINMKARDRKIHKEWKWIGAIKCLHRQWPKSLIVEHEPYPRDRVSRSRKIIKEKWHWFYQTTRLATQQDIGETEGGQSKRVERLFQCARWMSLCSDSLRSYSKSSEKPRTILF